MYMPETDEEVNSRSYHEPPANATYAGLKLHADSVLVSWTGVQQSSVAFT